jgi:hypothetical protein
MEALPEGKNLHAHIIKIGYLFDKISGWDVVFGDNQDMFRMEFLLEE